MNRRKFLISSIAASYSIVADGAATKESNLLMTVNGPLDSRQSGFILAHEHILVDFSGAENYNPAGWDPKKVVQAVIPHLKELKEKGCDTLIDFTPEYLGRDPLLLNTLSKLSGLNILTNTGYYGAVNNKFLPPYVLNATAEELSKEWIEEFSHGIANTGIKPGFIKISVDPDSLSQMHQKLVKAACLTHLKTGLVVASHTGPAVPAFQQLEVLSEFGVHPSAFIWVHAQNETNKSNYLKAAELGAWVSLDGIQENNCQQYLPWIEMMKKGGYFNRLLISQDAGWYEPGKAWSGPGRKYTAIFNHLIPLLRNNGFTDDAINQLFIVNPSKAFAIKVRKL